MKWIEIENQGLLFTEEEMQSNSDLAKIVSLNAGHTESTPKESSSELEINQRMAVKDCCSVMMMTAEIIFSVLTLTAIHYKNIHY